MKQYIILADLDKCIGCKGGCQVACKAENEVALGSSRSTLYNMGPTGVYPDLQMYCMPVMCQQCENPSCVEVCATGACQKSEEDGVVRIDSSICANCGSCARACPYGALNVNREMNVMDKCTICAQRREAGSAPACVKNCSGRALLYGDVNDPESVVCQAMEAAGPENVHSLPDFGNAPSGRFILRGAEWLDVVPAEFEREVREGVWARK